MNINWDLLKKGVSEIISLAPPEINKWYTLEMNIRLNDQGEIIISMPVMYQMEKNK